MMKKHFYINYMILYAVLCIPYIVMLNEGLLSSLC